MERFKSKFLNYNKTRQSCLISTLFILFLFQPLSGCKKDDGYGSVKVTVLYGSQKISNPKIFYKKGTLTNPNILLANYDVMLTSNSSGETTINNIAPGNYFFYATGVDTATNKVVEGGTGVTVYRRFRGWNTYDVIIITH